MSVLLEIRGLTKTFSWSGASGGGRRALCAVDEVDLDVLHGECLAVVGESGSGKTTLARSMIRLLEPDRGSLRLDGVDLRALSGSALAERRRRLQMVFQDSGSALDPRLRVGEAVAEPYRFRGGLDRGEIRENVRSLLATVGLPAALGERYPHQLSGGQRQRVAIARALASDPELLILDEPVSALDVSVRTGILRLLEELRQRLSLTLVFIAHDLAMVEQIADRIAVLYLGRLIEVGPCREVFASPRHPYTAGLLAAVPKPDPEQAARRRQNTARAVIGELPSAWEPPSGCTFHPRCPVVRGLDGAELLRCRRVRPLLGAAGGERSVACHLPLAAPNS